MKKLVYAVFDVGKTNKKLLIFDEHHQLLEEQQQVCLETVDDDGFPCETLPRLTQWVEHRYNMLRTHPDYALRGVNFTAYGASLVHLGADGRPVAPLYNYLKPLPEAIAAKFYAELGQSPEEFALATCSPQLGMLNSGLQLYWLKHAKAATFARIHTSLHLPQYLSYLVSGEKFSDYTSLGCHTGLWDYSQGRYHDWVLREGLDLKLAPITPDPVASVVGGVLVGVGMHDSSAAVLPYAAQHDEPFLLVSTGTWAVVLNPFNRQPLTAELLRLDGLRFMSPKGQPTLAARVFMGREHDYQVQRIVNHFGVQPDFYHSLMVARPLDEASGEFTPWCMVGTGPFPERAAQEWDLAGFGTAGEAYQHLMHGLLSILKVSIDLVRQDEKTIFVDGGFARNPLFMQMLGWHYPDGAIRTLEVPQATALGGLLHLEQGEAHKKTEPLFSPNQVWRH